MPYLNLKPTHQPVKEYYKALGDIQQLSLLHEGAVAPQFANLLRACASRMNWTLAEQHQIPRKGRKALRADGVFLDQFKLRHGVWEAKDSHDDLDKEVKKKFSEGYPQDNILFQAPDRAILVQNGVTLFDEDITNPDNLVDVLKLFCEYQPPEYEQWDVAVDEFKERVPELAQSLLALIEVERKQNKKFRDALADFKGLMRDAINPNLSDSAVEEMLIQHLLTERIFRRVFNNPDFAQRNIIAREIEKVISALTSRSFSRADFLKSLDRFYGAIETTAATIEAYSEKQEFLNTVYEKFFQGFSVKVADTHGIVYTPQPIVDFMVRSVDDILKREFAKPDGLASDGVAVLDPFVGTGNFMLRVMHQIPKSKLPHKYAHDFFCNEVMLLPYYIASMNIEHEYYELTGRYEPFDGISLVDTFELAEGRQMPLFAP
ncbi:MAG: N-6 DNA methylase, partial [Anaerolineae bacterium]|nr:N-6 DNA methylase [Anaerolineae bacterium]